MSDVDRTLTITLPAGARELIEAYAADAGFATPDEAAAQAIYQWQAQRTENTQELRRMIQESLDDPRPDVPAAEVFDRLEAKIRARMRDA